MAASLARPKIRLMPDWAELFRFSRPLAETFVRGTATFLAVYVLMRVAGKREGGGHSLTDLLVVVLIAQASGNALTGQYEGILDGLLLVATILFWSVALDAVAYRVPRLAALVKSRPAPLIVDGQINQRALRRELMSREELNAELRLHGIHDVSEVLRACLEPNGMVSVVRKTGDEADSPARPPTV